MALLGFEPAISTSTRLKRFSFFSPAVAINLFVTKVFLF